MTMLKQLPFRLGGWRVEPGSRTITDGARQRRLSPRAMDSLLLLARAGGEVVTRQELLDTVWPEVTVSDESVTTAIAELRRCFSDRHVIETIPRAGYRLTKAPEAEVERVRDRRESAYDQGASDFDLDAYLLCIEADRLRRFGGASDIQTALLLTEEATKRAPMCAATRAEHALTVAFQTLFCAGDPTDREVAIAMADEARGRRPDRAMNHLALGVALTAHHDERGARAAFERALALDPNNGEAWYHCSLMYCAFGAYRSASRAAERSAALLPDDYRSLFLAAMFRDAIGEHERAQTFGRAAAIRLGFRLAVDPAEPRGRAAEAALLAMRGNGEAALDSIVARGRDCSALQFYSVAAFTTLGETGRALDELERLVDEGHHNAGWVRFNPTLRSLWHERRYQRLLRQLHLN